MKNLTSPNSHLTSFSHSALRPTVETDTLAPRLRAHRWQRQLVSLLLITNVSSYLLYLTFATLSYLFMFDKELMRHPKILPNQIAKEMVRQMELALVHSHTLTLTLCRLSPLPDTVGRVQLHSIHVAAHVPHFPG